MASLAAGGNDKKDSSKEVLIRGEIDDLMDLHKNHLKELKTRCADVLDLKKYPHYDDIFCLRYLLSNAKNPNSDKGMDLAEAALRRTISWREENADLLNDIKNGKKVPFDDVWRRYMGVFRTFLRNKGPINFVIVNHSSTKALMDDHPFEKVKAFCLFTREEDFLICDRLTRETRKLVKTVSVIDMYDMSVFSGDADKRFAKALGDASNMSTDLYPQFLDKSILVNLPNVFNWVWKILKLFMSERTLAKIVLHPVLGHGASDSVGSLGDLCDVDEDNIPDFLGGKFDTTEALRSTRERKEASVTVTIPARMSNECRINISEANSMVAYLISVAERNVILSAKIVPLSGPDIVLFESRKVNATEGTITGNWIAPLAGTLVITFDNTYSMLRSKTVRYCIQVVSNNDTNSLENLVKMGTGTESD